MQDYKVLKIAVCGAAGAGKSSLCSHLSDRKPKTEYISTIGVDLMIKYIPNSRAKIHYWDFAGEKRFDNITIGYLKGISLLVYVYNIEEMGSIHRMTKLRNIYSYSNHFPKAIVVGTHSESYKYSYEKKGKEFADSIEAPHILVSSKTKDGIKELIQMIEKMVVPKEAFLPPPKQREENRFRDQCLIL